MDQFPPLERWFDLRLNVPNPHKYTRHDLCIKRNLSRDDLDELVQELTLAIARLRLRQREYEEWLKYWANSVPIPPQWKNRFRHRFWRSFVSDEATRKAGGTIQFDETAFQGYLGEVMLYLIQTQYCTCRIRAVPRRPKEYSKDSGIDCLELCGIVGDPHSLHYIVWESKGTSSDTLGSFPGKIYNQHLEQTPKSFSEMVEQLSDIYEDDAIVGDFVDEMIDDFYLRPPSRKKCFGGCVSYGGQRFARSDAFSAFQVRFRDRLADNPLCRQIRLCAAGDFAGIACQVRDRVWTKLLP